LLHTVAWGGKKSQKRKKKKTSKKTNEFTIRSVYRKYRRTKVLWRKFVRFSIKGTKKELKEVSEAGGLGHLTP